VVVVVVVVKVAECSYGVSNVQENEGVFAGQVTPRGESNVIADHASMECRFLPTLVLWLQLKYLALPTSFVDYSSIARFCYLVCNTAIMYCQTSILTDCRV